MSEVNQDIAGAIVSHLKELVAGSEHTSNITADTDLMESGLLDSLNMVRMIQFVETQFKLRIDEEDIGPDLFANANALASYVQSKA